MQDAWAGLCLYLEATCELQASDRGFDDLAGIRLPSSPCIDAIQDRIVPGSAWRWSNAHNVKARCARTSRPRTSPS